ncbi:MAG: PatB family C-S lyase [Bacteroidales bacterium]|nr:PatB family C-S lyase [Bacteroidales bacterium]
MQYDFDEIVSRENTDCLKYDTRKETFSREDVIPMWIADMDIKTPPFIMDAIRKRLEHEVLGYTMNTPKWIPVIQFWAKRQYGWDVHAEYIEHVSGIVPAISFAIQALTQEGDNILIQPPVYHPYFHLPEWNGRNVVTNPLKFADGQYHIDFEDLQEKVKSCKLMLLCHPYNPSGRVWLREELERIAQICYDNNVIVISDEIHADMTFKGFTHIPFATISEKAKMNSITMKAASKSFNIAGLISSFTIIPNPELRERYNGFLRKSELNHPHIFATIATAAAFTDQGAQWLEQLVDYLTANVDYLQKFLAEKMPLLSIVRPQASYLVFIDCRKLNMTDEQLSDFFINKAGLGLISGAVFGEQGRGFVRMNIGCPRPLLQQALNQLLQGYIEVVD